MREYQRISWPSRSRARHCVWRIHAQVRPREPLLLQCRAASATARRGACSGAAMPRPSSSPGSSSTCCSAPPTRAFRWSPPTPSPGRAAPAQRPLCLQPQGSQGPRRRRHASSGSALAGRVVIVDDVITAGTAMRESIDLIRRRRRARRSPCAGARSPGARAGRASAVQELEAEYGLRCVSILTLDEPDRGARRAAPAGPARFCGAAAGAASLPAEIRCRRPETLPLRSAHLP